MIKNVCFDLDGTLVDSSEDLQNILNYTLKIANAQMVDKETTISFVGKGLKNMLKAALEYRNVEYKEELFDELNRYYEKHPYDYAKAYDGVEELLKRLDKDGFKIFIITNKDQEIALKVVEKLFKSINITKVVGIVDYNKIKPNPKIYSDLKKEFDLKDRNTIFIGDSQVDKDFAINSNLDYRLVPWGFQLIEDEKTVNSLEDLIVDIYDHNIKKKIREYRKFSNEEITKKIFLDDLRFKSNCIYSGYGPGSNALNEYTILRISKSITKLLFRREKKRSVIIGYEEENQSLAKLLAAKIASENIETFIYDSVHPKSMLVFSAKELKASICVFLNKEGLRIISEIDFSDELNKIYKNIKLDKLAYNFTKLKSLNVIKSVDPSLDVEYFNHLNGLNKRNIRVSLRDNNLYLSLLLRKLGYLADDNYDILILDKEYYIDNKVIDIDDYILSYLKDRTLPLFDSITVYINDSLSLKLRREEVDLPRYLECDEIYKTLLLIEILSKRRDN